MAKTAALYVRSSKDRHDVSVESQSRELRQFAEGRGDQVVAEFVDHIESAKSDARPGFQLMIAEVKSSSRRFDALYCYDTGRFSRRQYHAQIYKQLLKSHGVELLFLKLPKTDSILDPIIESLMEAFDEFHSQKSKMDGLRGMRENVKQGWRAGGRAVLGYRLQHEVLGVRDGRAVTKSKLVPDPKTFNTVQRYLQARARGEPRRSLQLRLNFPIPVSTLIYMEDNALTYAGHTLWNRHRDPTAPGARVKRKGRYRDVTEWEICRNTHQAMITEEEAKGIFEVRARQRALQGKYRCGGYLLSGLLACVCGARMHGETGFYRCSERCGVRGIKQETLEHAVFVKLSRQFFRNDHLSALRDEVVDLQRQREPASLAQRSQLGRELRDLDHQIDQLTRVLTEVRHRRPILERIDTLEERREALAAQLLELQQEDRARANQITRGELRDFAQQWLTAGGQSPRLAESRKTWLRQVLARVTYDGAAAELVPKVMA